MDVSIFGLGYVGCVSLGCLAEAGHNVIGVDINSEKVGLINQGKPTIIEDRIDVIIREQHEVGRISATTDYREAVLNSEISIICVGTPSSEDGHLKLDNLFVVAEQIGTILAKKAKFHAIVIRSTVPPGTNDRVGQIVEKVSGKAKNVDFGVVSNPEFLREGSAVDDYYNPGIIVLGSDDERSSNIVKKLYNSIDAPVVNTDVGVAEMIKYVNNSFHALKIAFGNEVGNICKKLGIDSHQVFDVFCRDNKLNISPKYFKPGFAYGGSCLPKDLKALKTLAHDFYLKSPVIDSIEESNDNQKDIAFNMVVATGKKSVGVVGLSFKAGTDDLRNSPTVELVERLLGKGFEIMIYDKNVFVSKLTGTNKVYIEQHIPHLAELITDDLRYVVDRCDVLVVSHNYDELSRMPNELSEKIIIDLVRLGESVPFRNYKGICW